MKLEVFFTHDGVGESLVKGKLIAVIDVLRVSTTIAYAHASGAERIVPVESVEAASKLAASLDKAVTLLGGEKEGKRIAALECSAYILCDMMQIDRKIACKFLNKHFTIVSRYITAARFYDANHPHEKDKVNKLKQVQAIVFSHPYIIEKYPNIEL